MHFALQDNIAFHLISPPNSFKLIYLIFRNFTNFLKNQINKFKALMLNCVITAKQI